MELGYIGLPDASRAQPAAFTAQTKLDLADRLKFQSAYFPQISPQQLMQTLGSKPDLAQLQHTKIALDASTFGTHAPSQIEEDVRCLHDNLGGQLTLGVQMHGPDAPAQSKAQAQTFETLFSYDPRADQGLPAGRFPMKLPRPDIIGLPITGSCDEARRAAARGYFPMSPSWLPENDVARLWPAIVAGATSAVRRACPSHWHVNRVVLVHDNAQLLNSYIYASNSPLRRHFTQLAKRGLIHSDVDALLRRVVIAGPAEKVAQDILKLREAVGAFGTLNIVDPPGSDPHIMKRTMIELAENILPLLTRSGDNPLKKLENT